MTRDEVETYLREVFPQLFAGEPAHRIEAVGALTARVRLRVAERHLRPGGTVSGPVLMELADVAFYVALLANLGPVGLAVTTNLAFNFLRKPEPRDIVAECRILKLGKRLAIGEIRLAHAGSEDLVCHATGTYSIPPGKAVS